MTEQQLLADVLQRLNRLKLEYMLTGSMASNYWGIPRTTHDLDFVVQIPPSIIPSLVDNFQSDYYIDEQAIRQAYRPPWQFNVIDLRSALKVDFWVLKNEPFEREMFRRRTEVTIFGVSAWVATPEDVILHKLYWDRLTPSERQLHDAAGVVAVQGDKINREYLRAWGQTINVSQTLERLLSGQIQPKQT
jgi:hypothetical protein